MIKRFVVLDSFRGLAAIFVVLFHMNFIGSITELSFFKQSDLFVDFFFVLSGFVLTHGYAFKENITFREFIISRTFRLFPLHIFVLLVLLIIELSKLVAYNNGIILNNQPFSNTTSVSEILPNLLLLQAWIPNALTLSWNIQSWSISVEYYIYMIFFITLLIKNTFKYLLWLVIFMLALTIILNGTTSGATILRGVVSFFAGVITYTIYQKIYKKILFKKNIFTLLEITLLVVIVLTVSYEVEHKSLIVPILFSVVVFIFSFEEGIFSRLFKNSYFVYLGKLSYSIYMMHLLILFITLSFLMVIQKVFSLKIIYLSHGVRVVDFGNPFFNNIIILVILFFIVFISKYSYKFIEVKGQKLGKKIKERV